MATPITKYLDKAGKAFDTEVEANASDAKAANQAAVDAFVATHYTSKSETGRKSPAATAARNAIYKWLGSQNSTVTLEA